MMTSRSGTPVGLAHRWTARAAFADKVATTESTINPASANAARPRIHIPEIRPLAIIALAFLTRLLRCSFPRGELQCRIENERKP
jgi:hypothetical protein